MRESEPARPTERWVYVGMIRYPSQRRPIVTQDKNWNNDQIKGEGQQGDGQSKQGQQDQQGQGQKQQQQEMPDSQNPKKPGVGSSSQKGFGS